MELTPPGSRDQSSPSSAKLGGAAPRRQGLRSHDDLYTPEWVRYDGVMKEGFCGLCEPPGRWLQLKNSAFWYHKQFVHGISAISGRPFVRPLALRTPSRPLFTVSIATEGLCHQCGDWHPASAVRALGATVLWFRHAHK
ncbi:hypothetical protein DFJ73DRAFT_646722, partial [Zopfochytrium polystomum]